MFLNGSLRKQIVDTDKQSKESFEILMKKMLNKNPIDENLKDTDLLKLVSLWIIINIVQKKLYINEQAFQSKLAKQYSTENLFKSNRQTILDIDDKTEQVQIQMIQYKENFFTKFINAIKNILKK